MKLQLAERLNWITVPQTYNHPLLGKTAQVLIIFVLLAILPYFIPGLGRLRVLMPEKVVELSHFNDKPARPAASDNNQQNTLTPAPVNNTTAGKRKVETTPGKIEDPSGVALNHFFTALQSVEEGCEQVVISHYGDSPITNDGITATLRRNLQNRFGDAGHGFVLIDRPWGWYRHEGVTHEPGPGWKSNPMFISRGDHIFGFGGASFTASQPGVTASFGSAEGSANGNIVGWFDIYYLIQPGGGEFDIEVDGINYTRINTAGDEILSGYYRVIVDEGQHKMTIRTTGNGQVRLFGVVVGNKRPGVQYDSLGVNGAFIGLLANYMNEWHWAEQLHFRNPNLVIIGYGANESQFDTLPMKQYEQDTKEAIRRIRAALPTASIMLLGPMDRGMRGPGGTIVTRPMIPKLVEYQRRIAAETGCAFFDTYTAMGGEGTVARWYEARPRLMGGDFTHPTAQGSEFVGDLIYQALLEAYQQYKQNLKQ